jgi:hypothetical protein
MKVYILKDEDIEALRGLLRNAAPIEAIIDQMEGLPPCSRNLLAGVIVRSLGAKLEDILHRVTE